MTTRTSAHGSPSLSAAAIEFLRWAVDDYVEAFCLRDVIRRRMGLLTPAAEKDSALAVLSELILGGLLRVGEMRTDTLGLAFWTGSASDLVVRIKTCWSSENPPAMGEPPWFCATDDGKRLDGVIDKHQ